METEGSASTNEPGPGAAAPGAPAPGATAPGGPTPGKKRWWVVAGGAVAAAFLAAFGTWLFSRVSPILDQPFEPSPLQVVVDDSETECDSYALPASRLDEVPVTELVDGLPEQVAEFDGEWIVEHGGLPIAARLLELTMHGGGDETVVIHSIDVVGFEPVAPGEDLVAIYECLPFGGPMDVTSLATDFANRPPVLELTDPALDFPYQVSKDDPEVFDILITKQGDGDEQACFCRWNLGITWSAGAEQQQMVVEGESLGVATAIPSSEWVAHWHFDGEWSTEPPPS